MNIKLIPFSRLTIIFILAVTIPGGILSYLSIQNITNLKEVTERKVLIEEEALADSILHKFQESLLVVTMEFKEYTNQMEDYELQKIRFLDTTEFIESTFILNKNGDFIWPLFVNDIKQIKGQSSVRFRWSFSKAEKFEFSQRDYFSAKSNYLTALDKASDQADSAEALNAVARLCVKMNNNEEAIAYYSLLIKEFSQIFDKDGLPYITYILPQLIKLTDENNFPHIIRNTDLILSGLISGKIPLHSSTELLLGSLSEWLDEDSIIQENDRNYLKLKVSLLYERTSFIAREGLIIRDHLINKRTEDHILIDEEFYAIKQAPSLDAKTIIIYEGDDENTLGFILDIDDLADHAIQIDIPFSFSFKYIIELLDNENLPLRGTSQLASVFSISPLYSARSVIVRLKNEDAIDERVTRSSWIYGIAIILLIGGMILGVVLIIRDINRERHLSRLRSEFVSNVTHELKTPLTSIYMFAESILLGRVKTESEQKEYLGIILKETERLKRLINNILDFSRKEKGKQEYHFAEVNVSELVSSAINNLDYWIVDKQFLVQTSIDDNINAQLDPDAIKQALINLLSNAIKYSGQRKEINMRLWAENKQIFIEVEDKGIGIAEGEISRIFDKFYRIEAEETQETTGTGLGLTLVKEIVEAHNGTLKVESKIGEGSKFTIILNAES